MPKITTLTPDQRFLLPAVRDEWLAHGLSIDPAHRQAAEEGVRAAYRAAGLEPPRFMIWLGSPWAAVIGQAVAPEIVAEGLRRLRCPIPADQVHDQVYDQVYAQVRDQVYDQVDDQVRDQVAAQVAAQVYAQVDAQVADQVYDQVHAQVAAQVAAQVRDQVHAQVADQVHAQVADQVRAQVAAQVAAQVRDQVHAQVADQVHAQVADQVRDQVYAQVADQVRAQVYAQVADQVYDQVYAQVADQVYDQVRDQVYDQELKNRLNSWWSGRIDAQYWAGYYAYFDAMERLGVTGLDQIHGQQQVARSASWWWCFRDFAILTERPAELHRDQLGRLHHETGMAIRYPDGWGFYAWHGTRVPAWVVCDPTVKAIADERNQEIRRCGIESMGWDRFIQEAQLRAVDRCPDPGNPGHGIALYDVPEELWGERVRVLLCANGTVERDGRRRRFGLTVPEDIPTALDAAAWGYGITASEYAQLEVRR